MSWMHELRAGMPDWRAEWHAWGDIELRRRVAFLGLRAVQLVAYGAGWWRGRQK